MRQHKKVIITYPTIFSSARPKGKCELKMWVEQSCEWKKFRVKKKFEFWVRHNWWLRSIPPPPLASSREVRNIAQKNWLDTSTNFCENQTFHLTAFYNIIWKAFDWITNFKNTCCYNKRGFAVPHNKFQINFSNFRKCKFTFLMSGQDFSHPRRWCIMKEKIPFILPRKILVSQFLLLLSFSLLIKTINFYLSLPFLLSILFFCEGGISGHLISELSILISRCCLFFCCSHFFSSHQILSISFSLLLWLEREWE